MQTYGVSEELEFTPTSLIQRLKNRKLELGLVIDLTNTKKNPKKYYDPSGKHTLQVSYSVIVSY